MHAIREIVNNKAFEERPMKTSLRDLAILSIVCLISGCGTMQLPDYPLQNFSGSKYSATGGRLAVAVHPIVDRSESEKYFGVDLISQRVLAVVVTVENQSPSTSFLLTKDKFSLNAEKIASSSSQGGVSSDTGARVVQTVGVVATVAASALAPVFILAGAKMESDAATIKYNLEAKELQVQTISPGKSIQGFIYFNLPEKGKLGDKWLLHLDIPEIRSEVNHQFDFPLFDTPV